MVIFARAATGIVACNTDDIGVLSVDHGYGAFCFLKYLKI